MENPVVDGNNRPKPAFEAVVDEAKKKVSEAGLLFARPPL
jgi:hypothetical protein